MSGPSTSGASGAGNASDLIIDFHAHPGFSPSAQSLRQEFQPLLREARYHHVDRICLSAIADWSESPTPGPVREGNEAVLGLMSDYPGEVIGFCYVNPRYPERALQEIDRCLEAGMAGIKLLISCRASDERVDPIAARAAERRVPILQHAWYKTQGQLANESTPADVAILAGRHPETMIVMPHLTGWGERGLADVAPYENVSVDIAGGDPEAGLTELAVRKLGARRVVFGTDSPIRSYGVTLGKVHGARLSPAERSLILGQNAARLLSGSLGQ
jgi:predicted TIM-barrel fold metal-dependent hydrolase